MSDALKPKTENDDTLSVGPVRLGICNERGLHARASAKFVKTAESFDAEIEVSKSGETVDGKSILDLMMLAASQGCWVDVTASGPQAQEAVVALTQLVEDKFGEES